MGDKGGEKVTLFNIAMIHKGSWRLAEAEKLLVQVVAIDEAMGHADLASDRGALEAVRAELRAQGEGREGGGGAEGSGGSNANRAWRRCR